MEAQDDTEDIIGDKHGEKQRIISSSSAFTPVKPFADFSSSFSLPPGVDPPPFLPTLSPPGWYSSLLSSLYQTSSAIMRQEQNNNNLKEESDEKNVKEDSDEKHDKEDSDEIHENEQSEIGEKQSGWSNTARIMFRWPLCFPYTPHATQTALCSASM